MKKPTTIFGIYVVALSLLCLGSFSIVHAQEAQQNEKTQIAGEFFGIQVPLNNYYFAKRVVMTFNAKWRGTPQNDQELEELVWQELLFSYEAYRRGIEATDDDIDREIEALLRSNKVTFDWRADKEQYQKWVQDTLGVPVDVFRNQIEHLVKLEKLRQQVIDSFNPEVTADEAYQKFLDEYNTLLVELRQFDEREAADQFYALAIQPLSSQALDELIWQDAVLSYEASKRNVCGDDESVDKAIESLLRGDEVRFRWKDDASAYQQWVSDKFGMTADAFRNRMSSIVAIDTLAQKIYTKEQPDIDHKTYQKLLNRTKSIEKSYLKFCQHYTKKTKAMMCFKTFDEARSFYEKITRAPGPWEQQKRLEPKAFRQPGFVALDFLIHMWGFQREDAYKMLDAAIGSYYPPAPIYKGVGVFKILKVRKADPAEYEQRKDSYLDKVKMIKKYAAYQDWVKEFKKQANIKILKP
ncbi:MAG: hypothetical protein PHO30_06885 [Candidatus Omnitrophica bacterium]|nr:hypothetical protein [Candidatus Omnitrophota bacterium]